MSIVQRTTRIDARFSKPAGGFGQVTWRVTVKNKDKTRPLSLKGKATVRTDVNRDESLGEGEERTYPNTATGTIPAGDAAVLSDVVKLHTNQPAVGRMILVFDGHVVETGEHVYWSDTVVVGVPDNKELLVSVAITPTGELLTMTFDASLSEGPDGTPLTFSWDFGDGGTSTEAIEDHPYPAAGTYNVVLTVTDQSGDIVVVRPTVTVFDAPGTDVVAKFTWKQVGDRTIAFDSSDSEGNIAFRTWRFGDGATGHEVFEHHTYVVDKLPAHFVVELMVQDSNRGVSDTLPRNVSLYEWPTSFIVRGTVRDQDRVRVPNLVVRAFDLDLRTEEVLGSTITNANGYYEIPYTAEQFKRAEKGSADLVVRVFSNATSSKVLAESAILCNAGPDETIDLDVITGIKRSEYQLLATTIEPLLVNQGVGPGDLTQDDEHQDYTFLSCETDEPIDRIAAFATAWRFKKVDTDLLEPEIYYGFLRTGLPNQLHALMTSPDVTYRNAIGAAAAANIIQSAFGDEDAIDVVLGKIKTLKVRLALRSPDDPTKPSRLADLLDSAMTGSTIQSAFLTAYINHAGTIETFWDSLSNDPDLEPHVGNLQRALQLGALTAGHRPLVDEIQAWLVSQGSSNLSDLVKRSESEWAAAIGSGVGFPDDIPGATPAEQQQNYARMLTRLTEEAFPNAAIAYRLPDSENEIATFLAAAEENEFDIGRKHIASYFEARGGAPEWAPRLMSLQRLFQLAPHFDDMMVLDDAGLTSAHAITQMSQLTFVQRFGANLGGADRAEFIYESAAQVSASAMQIVAKYAPWFDNVDELRVFPDKSKPVPGVPNLETLFGTMDLCACDHCRSVYSPAAYLVDVLSFLNHRQSRTTGKSVKGVLFDRRPDLGKIELTCDNTNLVLPYIDLVNEILEDAVAAVWPPSTVPARQTSGTPAELAASPQHVNSAAYTKLRGAKFPWVLPFELSIEEARTYLDHLGVPLFKLMETFQETRGADKPTNLSIAAEFLGLSPRQLEEVTDVAVSSPWQFWGLKESGNVVPAAKPEDPPDILDWIPALQRLRQFLDRSGLNYDELEELLRLDFVNHSRFVQITARPGAPDNTCDTAWLQLSNLDAERAHRMHRFLRLWRQLGWTMRDIDKSITALKPGELTDRFVQLLASVDHLRQDLGQPLTVVLSWFGRIDSAFYDDRKRPRPRSLYEERFLHPSVVPIDPATDPFRLNSDGTELAEPLETGLEATGDSSIRARLRSVLRLKDTDLDILIFGQTEADPNVPALLVDKKLDLRNLSLLFRAATFAQALRLSVEDFLLLRDIVGTALDPFLPDGTVPTPNDLRRTRAFVYIAQKLAQAGIKIAELNYWLRHEFNPKATIAPTDESIAVVLEGLRTGLRKIHDDTLPATDPTGEQTAKSLAFLKWHQALIDEVVNTLHGRVIYTEKLESAPPDGFPPPEPPELLLEQLASYDSDLHELRFLGPMSNAQLDGLLALPGDAGDAFHLAVKALYDAPQVFLTKQLQTLMLPSFAAKIEPPDGLVIPLDLKERFYYDGEAKALKFVGRMTDSEKTRLLALLSGSTAYRNAVNKLFAAQDTYVPDPKDVLLTPGDVAVLLDGATGHPANASDRFDVVLLKLLIYIRRTQSEGFATQLLADTFKLEAADMGVLLRKWIESPSHPPVMLLDDFLADAFVSSFPTVKITREAFGEQFAAFTLLQKVGAVMARFEVSGIQIPWVFFDEETGEGYADEDSWLNLARLPIATGAPPPFAKWSRLVDLFQLRDTAPLSAEALDDSFRIAHEEHPTKASYALQLAEHTGWSVADIRFLLDQSSLGLDFPEEFEDERALVRMLPCCAVIKRLGVSAKQCHPWARLVEETSSKKQEQHAVAIKQAAKAKHDLDDWLSTIARPLRDTLRDKQRAALVAYLLVRPASATGAHWRDEAEMYEYFLIDVAMDPCQLTTRMKQAMSSVQQFVQRCLMNLEPNVVANEEVDHRWREWKWMKNYRVWEANRKIFLYPENWIEPELRDDKSPFFKELENELMQGDVTADLVEAAFLNYLEKLDQVAQLEIIAVYLQEECDGSGQRSIDRLHVIGRTHGTPHRYFYRQRVDQAYWTAWEKIDLDIEGDHLIAVVWNRRLHLLWPIFTEKAVKQPMRRQVEESPPPERYYEIRLAWSELKGNKWTPKRTTRPHLETRDLTIDEIHPPPATSREPFHTFTPTRGLLDSRAYTFRHVITAGGELRINCYAKLFPNLGLIDAAPADLTQEKDWEFFWYLQPELFGTFDFGCNGHVQVNDFGKRVFRPNGETVVSPLGTHTVAMQMLEDGAEPNTQHIQLVAVTTGCVDPLYLDNFQTPVTTLGCTPGIYSLSFDAQDFPFAAAFPIFYRDMDRTFFIHRQYTDDLWSAPQSVSPELVDVVFIDYFRREPRHVGAVISSSDAGAAQLHSPAVLTDSQHGSGASDAVMVQVEPGVADLVLQPTPPERAVTPIFLYGIGHQYRFWNFYHPYLCLFIAELNRAGVGGLLRRAVQVTPNSVPRPPMMPFSFKSMYEPFNIVARGDANDRDYPKEIVDFADDAAYSLYNWELFFHVPMLVATRLSQNQQFEEAQKWFHYIFNPTDTSGDDAPRKYWQTGHFYATTHEDYRNEQIKNLLDRLEKGDPDPVLRNQVQRWRANPFHPHVIARLRTTAYQRNVVMRYIDNLINWGDQLFGRDTLESINEATQLYVLAGQILGRRPEEIGGRRDVAPQTYDSLEPLLTTDDFSNPLVKLENLLPSSWRVGAGLGAFGGAGRAVGLEEFQPPLTLPPLFAFCVPKNDKLLGYWDTVADRLFKIRHCMNIEGVVRQLAIFEPPIDPSLLVRAAAAGLDLSSVLNDLSAPLPHYRFSVLIQKATELCGDLKGLGSALVAALEKRDAEEMALLRSSHELSLLDAVHEVRKAQVKEAGESLEATRRSQALAQERFEFYSTIAKINAGERSSLSLTADASRKQNQASDFDFLANYLALYPNLKVGSWETAGATFGGDNLAQGARAFGSHYSSLATMLHAAASLASTVAGHDRRFDDWKLQERLAKRELEQIDKQILAAEIRLAIAKNELANHELQMENAEVADELMRTKFTRRELCDWMVGQISAVYFQSYKLVYELAKRTERTFQYELGASDSAYVRFGYWDSLKKGLLAGEGLYHDLKRLELAYLDRNKRELEITKHVSVVQLDPLALLRLRQDGECEVALPEELFDIDFPGHYFRRIKSVSITIPCVVGPYTGVSCTLTLLRSQTRVDPDSVDGYREYDAELDDRFRYDFAATQSIATSSGQNDPGMFELNFRDERYLPFEGAGAISTWRIELPSMVRQFDYESISDVVLHLKYTARNGGERLKDDAESALKESLAEIGDLPLLRLFSLRHEFPSEWHRFTTGASTPRTQAFALVRSRFPLLLQRGTSAKISQILVYGVPLSDDATVVSAVEVYSPGMPTPDPSNPTVPPISGIAMGEADSIGLLVGRKSDEDEWSGAAVDDNPEGWRLRLTDKELGTLSDLLLVCKYTVTVPDSTSGTP